MAEIGIRKTHDNLKYKLADYIKAQYFAENDLLMNASDNILMQQGVIYQEPFIEVSKSYKQSKNGFSDSSIDSEHKKILDLLIEKNLGVFSTPFYHQIHALEHFYNDENILVSTGTGSGKTECFLWPILSNLIYEARKNSNSWEQEGIRALVLYPMNALVSDQLGRLRNIIGRRDDAYHKILSEGRPCRRARFGMYTGRTPYAGNNDKDKNKNLAGVIRKNFINNKAYNELQKIGRIPSKNLIEFANGLCKGIQHTSEEDSELYTRGEMQKICPDVLITNYSMLEYMLMRPIEDGFWNKTNKWLNESEDNKLLLVIDEAHMYRGAPGGEVSLLIRRLMDRLCIDDSKLRCILTSASVPSEKDDSIQKFAQGLTGTSQKNKFAIVRESLEEITGGKLGEAQEAAFYGALSLNNLQSNMDNQFVEIEKIANKLHAKLPEREENTVSNWLYENLVTRPIIKQILGICNSGGKSLTQIARESFVDEVSKHDAERALEIILQLGVMSKSNTGKVLLSSKVHMLFRGLQGLYACTNPMCTHKNQGTGIQLGYITNRNIEICPYCSCRMFELLMDRKCGSLFLRTFIDNHENNSFKFEFLWPRRNKIMKEPQELHLWLMPESRTDIFKLSKISGKAKDNSRVGYLDSKKGILFREESHAGDTGFLKVLISELYDDTQSAYSFGTCPNCGKDHNKVTPFITRGNEPFANIVKEQFDSQVPKDLNLKNEGKKVLLFSDSRQRAATLARDMTIAADGDAGRQAIFMAQKLLDSDKDSDRTLNLLYYAFLKVIYDNNLNFFYGNEKELLKNHLQKYEEFYSDRNRIKFRRMKENIGNPPMMFYQLLLKNISDSYRSYNNLGLAQIVLAESGDAGEDIEYDILEKVEMQTGLSIEDIRNIYNTWVQYLVVRKIAIFPEISDDVRNSILSYERGGFGIDEEPKFPEFMKEIFKARGIDDKQLKILSQKFDGIIQILGNTDRNHNRKFILGNRLELKSAENATWYKCDRCAGMSTYTLWGYCIYCGSSQHIKEVDKEHMQRYALWTKPVFDAIDGKKIHNLTTEEHTAQLSYKDTKNEVWGTTEKYELAFRNIAIDPEEGPIDVLSCTTTMEVGIDIGSLTSVGLRNVPPMRENYQQRAGRAGRAGAAVSSIVTYTENGPHDAWYFNHPEEIISGEPRTPWIDTQNRKLIKRHINLILLQEFFRQKNVGLDEVYTIKFFDKEESSNYLEFCEWMVRQIPFNSKRMDTLVPPISFNWHEFKKDLIIDIQDIEVKVKAAEFIYKPVTQDESYSNSYRLMDVLFTEGLLPNYSFPRNIVNFWIENLSGLVVESPERSIDIALSEYAPGRSLVVNKQTYISGGLYDYYTKFKKENRFKAAQPWLELDETSKKVQCCSNIACGWFGVEENFNKCPLCGRNLVSQTMIKPWGFTAREGRNIPETQENQELSYASEPSYSSLPSGNEMDMVGRVGYMKIENRENQKLVIINKGPDDEGFEMCSECGAIEPATTNLSERMNRKRPYRIPFMKDDAMRCRHNYRNIFLGYEFNTDMMVLEINLDSDRLDLLSAYNIWLIPALTTFAETLALAASRELDVEFNDMKAGFRIREAGNQLYADIYLYDSLSSGAGYACRVTEYIERVLSKMEEIYTSCNCTKACPNCLQHFGNQRVKDQLDRFLGLNLLLFLRDGQLRTEIKLEEKQQYVDKLNEIGNLHGMGNIIKRINDSFYLETTFGLKEVVFYPAMCNIYSKNSLDKIYLSDQLCKYALSEIWKKLQNEM